MMADYGGLSRDIGHGEEPKPSMRFRHGAITLLQVRVVLRIQYSIKESSLVFYVVVTVMHTS